MLGGGAGSILAMIQSLRSNKKLLRSRRSYFKRKVSISGKNKAYRKKLTNPSNRKPLSQEQILEIRKEFKKRAILNSILAIAISMVSMFLIVVWFISILTTEITYPGYKEQVKTVIFSELKPQPYRDNMQLGILKLKQRDFFMAAGNFKKALQYKRNNLEAEYYLTKSYCLMCFHRNQSCEKAKKKVKENQSKFTNDYKFDYLEKTYLNQ